MVAKIKLGKVFSFMKFLQESLIYDIPWVAPLPVTVANEGL